LRHSKPFAQLDTKIARARAQDEPVLYAHVLPGLDVLLCSVRGAHPPYPAIAELRKRCIESIANALEQPLDGLENGGYWYEANGFGFLVFASRARTRILPEFGAGTKASLRGGLGRQNAGDDAALARLNRHSKMAARGRPSAIHAYRFGRAALMSRRRVRCRAAGCR
jgi:hypothetical protein